MGAVIDPKAFEKIESYIEAAKTDAQATLVFGGACDDTDGYFIQPTLIETTDPTYRTMCEEIFGPVLSRSEEHTSELQSRLHLVCRLLLEKKKKERIHDLLLVNLDSEIDDQNSAR